MHAAGLTEVLGGRHPTGGATLRQAHGTRPVCGFDLVFAAPKAVSLLHLLAPRELGAATASAHGAAVADAVTYLEGAAVGVRRSRGGIVHHLGTTGVVAAEFVHRTSRALDPHLHSHVVTANVAQGLDGRWSSLDSRRLFLHRRAVQAVYDASLRRHLARSAGVAWQRGPTDRWEMVGVDPVLCRLFSQRAASIDEASQRMTGGRGSHGVRRLAYFADRPDKDRDVTIDRLQVAWTRRAAAVGLEVNDLVRVVGRASPPDPDARIRAVDVVGRLDRSAAVRTHLTSRDHVEAVADAAPQGLDVQELVRVAGAVEAALGARRHDVGPWTADRATAVVEHALAERAPEVRVRGHRAGHSLGVASVTRPRPPVELGR